MCQIKMNERQQLSRRVPTTKNCAAGDIEVVASRSPSESLGRTGEFWVVFWYLKAKRKEKRIPNRDNCKGEGKQVSMTLAFPGRRNRFTEAVVRYLVRQEPDGEGPWVPCYFSFITAERIMFSVWKLNFKQSSRMIGFPLENSSSNNVLEELERVEPEGQQKMRMLLL